MMKYVLILTVALAACNASEPQVVPQPQASQTATIAKKVILIDVRSPEEFQAGHLANAHNITHDQIDKKISALTTDKNAEIHLYCRTGRRAGIALETLTKMGYTNVKNLGGYDDLKNTYPHNN